MGIGIVFFALSGFPFGQTVVFERAFQHEPGAMSRVGSLER